MKKLFALGLLMCMLMSGTALADILPEGQKTIPVCAYFNNTADFLDSISVYGYETGPDGEKTDFSQYIANECFNIGYKFNDFGVYAVTVEHADTLDLDTYDPRSDEEAYPTNIDPEIGYIYVEETDTLESVSNEYTIVELDLENKVLVIEPVKTTKYFDDGSDPEVTEPLSDDDDGADDVVDIVMEDIFTDVAPGNKYYDALKYLKDEGIIGGYPDGSFKSNNFINRAEFTKIVVGSIASEDELSTCYENFVVDYDYNATLFKDVVFVMVGGNAPAWYYDFVCVAKLNGIIGGYPDGSFKPDQNINFVEGAKIITEALNLPVMANTDPWYMGYVKELENKNAIPLSITSFNKQLTRGEMSEIMYRLMNEITDLASLTYEDLM